MQLTIVYPERAKRVEGDAPGMIFVELFKRVNKKNGGANNVQFFEIYLYAKTILVISVLLALFANDSWAAEMTVYKNPDWGYEFAHPSSYIAVDRSNMKEKRDLVAEQYQAVVDVYLESGMVEGSVFLFSDNMMLTMSGEEYANNKDFKKYLSSMLSLVPPADDGKGTLYLDGVDGKKALETDIGVKYKAFSAETGEMHEFISKTYNSAGEIQYSVYTLLIPIKDKYLESGFTYGVDDEEIMLKMKKILLSIKESENN